MFSFLYRVSLKCPISDWLLSAGALTVCSDRFPSCRCYCIAIIALFKHYLLTDLNGSHPLCCAVASIQTNKRQRGGKLHQACLSHMILLWWPKVYLVHKTAQEVQNKDLQFQCLWFGRTDASDRVRWMTLRTSRQKPVPHWHSDGTVSTGVGYDATRLWTDDQALLQQDWQAVCFHAASHDWTMIDGQSITQEAPWPISQPALRPKGQVLCHCVTSFTAVSHFSW